MLNHPVDSTFVMVVAIGVVLLFSSVILKYNNIICKLPTFDTRKKRGKKKHDNNRQCLCHKNDFLWQVGVVGWCDAAG